VVTCSGSRPSPEHGLEDGLQGDLEVQLVGAGELHVDGSVPGDDVARVVHTLDPHRVLVHDVRAVRLPGGGGGKEGREGGRKEGRKERKTRNRQRSTTKEKKSSAGQSCVRFHFQCTVETGKWKRSKNNILCQQR